LKENVARITWPLSRKEIGRKMDEKSESMSNPT